MSGLLAAHRLQQAGVPFVIVDKNDDVGGTWCENTYPGCRVDNPNHNYSYSFAQRHDWPFHFSTQDVLHHYFEECADAFGLREHIRFSTEVLSADWSDDDLTLVGARSRGPTAPRRRSSPTRSSAPSASSTGRGIPTSRAARRFAGPAFHSARWDHVGRPRRQAGRRHRHRGERDAAHPRDRADRRRADGLPADARRGSRRRPTTTTRSPTGCGGCTRTCPRTASSTDSASSGRWATARSPTSPSIPSYGPTERSVSEMNDMMRLLLTEYITAEFGDRPDLLAARRSRSTRRAPSAASATTASGRERSSATTCAS